MAGDAGAPIMVAPWNVTSKCLGCLIMVNGIILTGIAVWQHLSSGGSSNPVPNVTGTHPIHSYAPSTSWPASSHNDSKVAAAMSATSLVALAAYGLGSYVYRQCRRTDRTDSGLFASPRDTETTLILAGAAQHSNFI